MSAFQTTLLPLATPERIQRLNHLPAAAMQVEALDVGEEIERLRTVVTPVGEWGRLAVHLVGDILDVLLNLRGWNDDIRTPEGQRRWGSRSVTYLVCDPGSGLFAPAKFCAYAPVQLGLVGGDEGASSSARMSLAAYADLNDGTHVMDGNRAQRHLTRALGMRLPSETEMPLVTVAFSAWCRAHQAFVTVKNDAHVPVAADLVRRLSDLIRNASLGSVPDESPGDVTAREPACRVTNAEFCKDSRPTIVRKP